MDVGFVSKCRVLTSCLLFILAGSASAVAQNPTQFRAPEIPALRGVGGQLISSPTRPQTTLQSLVQENQLRPRSSSEFPEYQFGNSSAGQFEELSAASSPPETALPYNDQNSGLETAGPGSSSFPVDPNFNGFTPRSSQSSSSFELQDDDARSFSSQEFDSEALRTGISEYLKNETQLQERVESNDEQLGFSETEDDSLEQLPPAMGETQNTDNNRTNKITQRFPNGNKRIVRTVSQDEEGNFSNHGPWEAFDLKGNSVAAGVFKRGVMQGQWRRQHSKSEGGLFATEPFTLYQGPYLSVANFKDGKLSGLWTIYDRFRSKIFEITYTEGVRNGTATWWYPNRAKMREATFKDGLLDGMIQGWDDSEKLTRREEYIEGRKIVRNVTFYRPKKPKEEEFFLDSKLEPEGEDNWWDAQPTPYLPRGSKVQNGGAAQWYENGQLKHQGQFKEGEPVGRFVWWHSNGNKNIQGMYVKGKKNRTWTWWHENGMKKTEGAYQDDQPDGIWRAWHDDGSLRNEENFSADTSNDSAAEPAYQKPSSEEDLEDLEDSGQSVIEPEPEPKPSLIEQTEQIEELPEELPQPQSQPADRQGSEPDSDSTLEIEGHDFSNPKSDVGSESFREPINPRDIDPFGEVEFDTDGSIPADRFEQPKSQPFNTSPEPTQSPLPTGQSDSDPFGDSRFQAPTTANLTT